MKTEFRAHPFMLFQALYPFLTVLVLPVAYGLVRYLFDRTVSTAVIMEIALLLALVLLGYKRMRAFCVCVTPDSIVVHTGVFLKAETVIRRHTVSVVKYRQNAFCAVAGCVLVRVNTEALSPGQSDVAFYLSTADCRAFDTCLFMGSGHADEVIRLSAARMALTAASVSSLATGGLITVPLLRFSLSLFGKGLEKTLYDTISGQSLLPSVLPPIFNAVTLAVLLFFAVGYLVVFTRYLRFYLIGNRQNTLIHYGLFSRNATRFSASQVNAVILEQNLLLRLLGRYNMKVEIGGINAQKGDSNLIAPAVTKGEANAIVRDCLGISTTVTPCIRPVRGSLHRYLFFPTIYATLTGGLLLVALKLFESFEGFWLFLLLVDALAYLRSWCLSLVSRNRSGLAVYENRLAISFLKGGRLRAFDCPIDKTACLCLRRTPADRRRHTLTLTVRLYSRHGGSARLCFVDETAVIKALNLYE